MICHDLLHGMYRSQSRASLRQSIADLSWLRNEIAHGDRQWGRPVGFQPQGSDWLLSPGDGRDVDRGLLRFIGEQPSLAWHRVARNAEFSPRSLVQTGVREAWAWLTRPRDEPSPVRVLIAWLSENALGSLLVLVIGIRAALCFILMLVSAALSRRSDGIYLTLVLIAVSRRFGRRDEPDDRIPALTSMSVVIGEAARAA
jgi:hypothetical protein